MNDRMNNFFKISGYVLILVLFIRCSIGWNEIEGTNNEILNIIYLLFGYAGEAISITTILMIAYNKFLWKVPGINIIAGKNTILEEQYTAKLKYLYKDNVCEKETKIIVEQTYLNCKIKLITDESESTSINFSFVDINNDSSIIFTYINIPKIEYRKQSAIHYGTAILKLDDKKLYGTYYTDRNTSGDIETLVKKDNN